MSQYPHSGPHDPYPGPYAQQGQGAPFGHDQVRMAPDGSDRGVAIFAHLAAPIGNLVSAGSLPFLGPLIVWLIYRRRSPFVRQAAAGSFNFNLGMTVLSLIGYVMVLTVILLPVGFILVALAAIFSLWFSIVGAIRASRGEPYRYPMQLRVLS